MAAAQSKYAYTDLPAIDGAAVTASDSVDFANVARGIYVGVAGDVVLVTPTGSILTFKNAAQGSVLAILTMRVNSTGTTATNLVALF